MLRQKDAILRLLRDNDPETIRLMKEELAKGGPDVADGLRELLPIDDEAASSHVAEILATIDSREAAAAFDRICDAPGDALDLEEAAWTLARVLRPGIDVESARIEVDRLGSELAAWLLNARTDLHRVEAIVALLAAEEGFSGNADDYYDPENSILPCVVFSREGNPLTLTLVYRAVGRRAGLEIEGVNLPGHFIARHGTVLFDPFHDGRILNEEDCASILKRQGIRLEPGHLAPAPDRLILVRMLANLVNIHHESGDEEIEGKLTRWMDALNQRM